ncbi:phage tail protein [Hydrocarboniphaga sp.]|uniref:phage tail protein n=1 Tax=Hydrocarboniphaga sp. TaxID=2033016 RepID=UPI003D0D9B76
MSSGVKKTFGAVLVVAGALLTATGVGAPIGLILTGAGAALMAAGEKQQAKAAQRRAQRDQYSRAIKGNWSGGAEHHLICFGRVRVGGLLMTVGSGDTLYLAIGHSICHPGGCDGIDGVYVDETFCTLDGSGYVTLAKYVSGTKKMVRATFYPGTATQSADPVLATNGFDPGSAYRRGIAWTRFDLLRTNDEQFSKAFSGIPVLGVVLRGLKCYDPRKDSTNGGSGSHRLATPTTWEFSTNPALIASTYRIMVVMDGGMGYDPVRVGWPSVIAAANICDETISAPSGTIKRYECNIALRSEDPRDDNHSKLLETMAGSCAEIGGVWVYYAGAYRTPTQTIDASWLRGPVSLSTRAALQSTYNAVRVTFDDASGDWASKEAPAIINATYEAQDAGGRLFKDVSLDGVTNVYQAEYLGMIESARSRYQARGVIPLNLKGLDVGPGDTLLFDLPEVPGLNSRVMRVTGWTFQWAREACGPVIELQEESSTIYQPLTFITPNSLGSATVQQQVPAAPLTISATSVADAVVLAWGASDTPNLAVQALVERSALPTSGFAELPVKISGSTLTYTDPITDGSTWYYRVRYKSPFGMYSGYSPTISSRGKIVADGADVSSLNVQSALSNPRFLAGDTGWSKEPGWDIVSDASKSRTSSAPYVARFTGGTAAIRNTSLVPVNADDRLSAYAFGKCDASSTGYMVARLNWYSAAMGFISTSYSSNLTPTTTYAQVSVTDGAPTGAAYVQFDIAVFNRTAGTWYCDDAWLTVYPRSQDEVPDGPTWGRTLIGWLSGGRARVDFNDVFHNNKNLDYIGDGGSWGRTLITRLNGGRPVLDFSESIHANKNLDYIGDGGSWARILASQLSSGQHKLTVAGSGMRLGDQRNAPAITIANQRSNFNGLSISSSYSSGSPSTVTISTSAATLPAGSVTPSYGAASVSVSQTRGTTVTYYLYWDDPDLQGGSRTLVATTNKFDLLAADGRVNVGSVSVTVPTTGSGSGGGGNPGGCPSADAVTSENLRFSDVGAGTELELADALTLSHDRGPVLGAAWRWAECVRVIAQNGASGPCSVTAQLATRGGRYVVVRLLGVGDEIATKVDGVAGWSPVADIQPIGLRLVRQVYVANRAFWFGDRSGACLLHHNEKP